ncbi:MAG: peptide ligase PGM1-related protein [Actinomycetota bacterium]
MSGDITAPVSFLELQARLTQLGGRGLLELENGTIVVLPSISFPTSELRKIIGIERYEERLLCFLLLLRAPELRMVFVSSARIDDYIIDHYLSFLDDPEDARRRVTFVSLDDEEPRALTEKLLENPAAIEEMRAAIGSPDMGYILPFNVTELEKEVAESLGIPVYGPSPALTVWGTKSGARQLARDAGVPVLEGSEDLFSVLDVERATQRVRARRPDAHAVVIKLNNGFSGQGNAIVRIDALRSPLDSSATTFCASEESWPSFTTKIEAEGAIVEEMVKDAAMTSPSVQVGIAPDGSVEIFSTHDQILGGPDDQVYLGCRFPARAEYRSLITRHAAAIGRALADRGVIGAFGIDFVVVPKADRHDVYLSEINLRLGGTTHPYLMAKLATGATYDQDSGELVAGSHTIAYLATDNLKSESYVGLEPERIVQAVRAAGLIFDPATGVGAALHLLGAAARYGKLGALCIGRGLEAAEEIYTGVVEAVDTLAAEGRQ